MTDINPDAPVEPTTGAVDNDGFYDPSLDASAGTSEPLPNPTDEANAPTAPYPAPDAPTAGDADAPAEPEAASTEKARTPLKEDVRKVLEDYTTGVVVLAEGKRLTPSAIAKVIGERRGGKAPSAGAVHAYLKRLVELGFITLTEDKPIAFAGYTDAARTEGFSALKEARSKALAQARHDKRTAEAASDGGAKHAPTQAAEGGDASVVADA